MTHICVGNLTIIGPDNGWSPGRRQAIIWTNAGILLIAPWGTNFSEILIGIHTFSFKKIHLKMSSAKWRLFRLDLNELTVFCFPMRMYYLKTGSKLHQMTTEHEISWIISTKPGPFCDKCVPMTSFGPVVIDRSGITRYDRDWLVCFSGHWVRVDNTPREIDRRRLECLL